MFTILGTVDVDRVPAVQRGASRTRLSQDARDLLGQRLRLLRGSDSLETTAARAGLSSGSLGQLERGGSDPTLGTLLRLMVALEQDSIECLLGDLPSCDYAQRMRSPAPESAGRVIAPTPFADR